jgi:hypothetical protein
MHFWLAKNVTDAFLLDDKIDLATDDSVKQT